MSRRGEHGLKHSGQLYVTPHSPCEKMKMLVRMRKWKTCENIGQSESVERFTHKNVCVRIKTLRECQKYVRERVVIILLLLCIYIIKKCTFCGVEPPRNTNFINVTCVLILLLVWRGVSILTSNKKLQKQQG